jgi:hypothetical protein
MSEKIFDLEQELLSCWHVIDDINLLYESIGDDPAYESLEPKALDTLMNLTLGLKAVYEMRFQKCWGTFEAVAKEYHHYRKLSGVDRDKELHALFAEAYKATDA